MKRSIVHATTAAIAMKTIPRKLPFPPNAFTSLIYMNFMPLKALTSIQLF